MKILVLGSNGFVGSAVVREASKRHEVVAANRKPGAGELYVDLLDKESIGAALQQVKPDVVINCAGVVENSEAAKQNLEFTKNLLESIVACKQTPKVLISGSAAEYGPVEAQDLPVSEDTPLNADNGYRLYKKQETQFALSFGEEHELDVVIARIFNPIGVGMHEKFLIPKLMAQLQEYEQGSRNQIEVNRLDALRDYIDVRDLAEAIVLLAEKPTMYDVYNLGSGVATSTGELIELLLEDSKIEPRPQVVESSEVPEALVASQADISRITNELGWRPAHSLRETIKEIVDATRQ